MLQWLAIIAGADILDISNFIFTIIIDEISRSPFRVISHAPESLSILSRRVLILECFINSDGSQNTRWMMKGMLKMFERRALKIFCNNW